MTDWALGWELAGVAGVIETATAVLLGTWAATGVGPSAGLRRVTKYETEPTRRSAATASQRLEVRSSKMMAGVRKTAGRSCCTVMAGGRLEEAFAAKIDWRSAPAPVEKPVQQQAPKVY